MRKKSPGLGRLVVGLGSAKSAPAQVLSLNDGARICLLRWIRYHDVLAVDADASGELSVGEVKAFLCVLLNVPEADIPPPPPHRNPAGHCEAQIPDDHDEVVLFKCIYTT